MKKFSIIILLSVSLISAKLTAQEYTSNISVNAEIKKFLTDNPNYSHSLNINKATLELPFWDDFSALSIYPNTELWIENQVYINSTLAEYPPSIGIATFDAADATGEIYSYADYEIPFIADSLTSQTINLNYPGDNSIFLSFYYQAQGIVQQAPEAEDSLILEFYAPEDDEWNTVWFAEGNTNPGYFEFVILPINEDKYLKDGFQFRFKNYVTLGSSIYPSLVGNSDFWHIDYVYLDRNRNVNDTVFHDIAFNKPLNSLLEDYDAIPWSHFKEFPAIPLKNNISVEYKNNDNVPRLIDSLLFKLTDLSGNADPQTGFGGSPFTPPFEQFTFTYPDQPFTFSLNSEKFCDFNFNARIVTSSFDSTQNNSISYTQKFRDYYSYDDGSAEAGYGIYGLGTIFGSVAYFFDPVKVDYLTGVYMYFTQTLYDASQDYFWIYIWKEGDDGMPGDTIRTIEGILPEYENEINQFTFYEFDDPILINGPFFIGWTQTTNDKLNIGFDYNTINNDKLYYNISGEWIQSQEQGSVMIRPAFGDIYSTGITETNFANIKLYPNPAIDNIFIELSNTLSENFLAEIYDLQGRLIYSRSIKNSSSINISNFKKGIYILKLINENSKIHYEKFIKQ